MTTANEVYLHHRLDCAPRQWKAVADALGGDGRRVIETAGGSLYGIWRSQIGRPRDELQAITAWPGPVHAADAERVLLEGENDIWIRRALFSWIPE